MKVGTKFFILIILLCVLCPDPVFSREKIVVNKEQMSLRQVLDEIEKQTIYNIGYSEAELDVNKKVNLSDLSYHLDDLLSVILKNTNLQYIIKDNHILIISRKNTSGKKESEIVYNGKVFALDNSTPLAYTTIILKNANKNVAIGVTNDDGLFSISSSDSVTHMQVRFLGYETVDRAIKNRDNVFEKFYLKRDSIHLQEAQVSASPTLFHADRISYLITKDMIKDVSNALELLDKLPEFRLDNVNKTAKTGKDEEVLFLIDGIQQSQDYIKSLSPERVLRMDVVHGPSGRFVSEHYSSIINYVLKKDYTGYDINVSNLTAVNPVGTNGDNGIVTEKPEFNFTYTKNKFNIYAHYDYDATNLNLSHYRFLETKFTKNQSLYYRTQDTSIDNPSDIYKNKTNHLIAGINYYLNPHHTISVQNNYRTTNAFSENRYKVSKQPEDNPQKDLFRDTTTIRLKDKDYKATLFYKGYVNEKVQLYCDISYNYYSDDVDDRYIERDIKRNGTFLKIENVFKEKKNQLSFNFEGNFILSPQHLITSGYSNNWREYISKATDVEFINYRESKNKFFIYLNSNLNEHIQMKVGSGFDYIDTKSINFQYSQWIVQPHAQLSYSPNKNLNLSLNYVTNSDNPTLPQLSLMVITLGTGIYQSGNPKLKASVNQIIDMRLSYKNRLFFKSEFRQSPYSICEIQEKEAPRFYCSTFKNIKTHGYSLQLDYIQPFLNYFNWKSSLIYYSDKAEQDGIGNKLNDWLIDARLDYFHPRYDFGAQFAYHRNMYKRIAWQGYQMVNNDKWEITLKKYCWNKQLALTLSYIPPIDWGVRYKRERYFDSNIYAENSYINMKAYRNMVFLKLEFRFNKGKVRPITAIKGNEDRRQLNL